MLYVLLAACSDYEINRVQDALAPNERPPLDENEEVEEDPIVPGEPVADAGPDEQFAPLETIVLDGTASYDPDGGDITKYRWDLVDAPDGSMAELDQAGKAKPTIWLDLAGDYVFELTVENDAGNWDSTPDTVVISAIPLDGFYVQLSWDTMMDMDLHLLEESAKLWENPGDCNYCNMTPQWGSGGPDDNPSLDWDTIFEGYGPETITVDTPATNTNYTAVVHYYGEGGAAMCWTGCEPTEATVDIYLNSELVASFSETLSDAGDTWTAAKIEFPSGKVSEINRLGSTNKISCDY